MLRALLLVPVMATLAATVACGCPPVLCTTWAYVSLRATAWEAGTYVLELDIDEVAFRCRFEVREDGVAPTLFDKQCGDTVSYADYVYDTGGTIDPLLIEVRTPVGKAARPEAAKLVLRHEAPEGNAVLIDENRPLDWRDRTPPGGRCETGCGTTHIEVDLPLR